MNNTNFQPNIDFEKKALTLKDLMIKTGVANPNLIKGCSREEIIQIEQENNVTLPTSYKVFLKNFGHGLGGRVMYDIDILYPKILGLTDFLRNEVLIEEDDPSLPEKAFVFAARYEEQFMFFEASGLVEEPPILYYKIDDREFTSINKTIFDILEKEIELSVRLKRKREQRKKNNSEN